MYGHFVLSSSMPGMADRISRIGAAAPTAAACRAACTRQMSVGAAVPLGAVCRRGRVRARRIRFIGTGIRSCSSSCARCARGGRPPLLAQIGFPPADRRTARAWSGRASCWPGRGGLRPPVLAPPRRASRPINRSVAMLSLAEIISWAAFRTETCVRRRPPARRDAADPTALASSVIVSWSVQCSVPALTASRNRKQHIQFEYRRQAAANQLECWCPRTVEHLPSVDLRDLIRVARPDFVSSASISAHCRIFGGCNDDREAVDQAVGVGAQFDVLGRRRRTSRRAELPARADVDARDGDRAVQPQVAHGARRRRRPVAAPAIVRTPTVPMGHSELSMSMVCFARRPCGVLIAIGTPYVASAAGATGVLSAAARTRMLQRARPRPTARVTPRALRLVARNVQDNLELEQRRACGDRVGAPALCAPRWQGPVAHAWNASSDSHCVTTK